MTESELCHYGVLGMRWGVRRYQNYDGTLTSAGKKHRKELAAVQSNSNMSVRDAKTKQIEQETASEYGKDTLTGQNQTSMRPELKPVSQMSDEEIRAFLNRVELERRYTEYMKSLEPKKEEPKKNTAVMDFIKKVGLTALTTVATKWATDKLSEAVFGKKSDNSDKSKDKSDDKSDSKKKSSNSNQQQSFFRQLYGDLRADRKERAAERREDKKERRKEAQEREEKEREERLARMEFERRMMQYVNS